MSISSIFSQSIVTLKNNPKLTVPFIGSHFLNNIIIFTLLSFLIFNTGYQWLFDLDRYNSIAIISLGFVIWFLLFSFFSCWGYYQNTQKIKGNSINTFKACKNSLNYYPKVVIVKFLYLSILLIPPMILFSATKGIFFITQSIIISSILLLIALILSIFWAIIAAVKLFFVQADIFMNTKTKLSLKEYFKHSYTFSKGRIGTVILLILLIALVHLVINIATSSPISNIVLEFFRQFQIFLFLFLGGLFFTVISIISGSGSAFTNLMLLQFYYNNKKDNKST